MFTIKIFAFLGLVYLFVGIFNIRHEASDKLYTKIWGVKPPTREQLIRLGVSCIIVEIMIDFIIYII